MNKIHCSLILSQCNVCCLYKLIKKDKVANTIKQISICSTETNHKVLYLWSSPPLFYFWGRGLYERKSIWGLFSILILLGNWNCTVQSLFLIFIEGAPDAITFTHKAHLALRFNWTSLISPRWMGTRDGGRVHQIMLLACVYYASWWA